MNIYYYCPFNFNFNAGATAQVIKDYKHLSKYGYNVFFYGTYDDEQSLKEIQEYIGNSPISLTIKHKSTRWNRNSVKFKFLWNIIKDRTKKIIISRNYNKIHEIFSLKLLLGKHITLLEMHEDALPHLLPKHTFNKTKLKNKYTKLFCNLNALILTNYSQEPFLKQEFLKIPPYKILPNGVEIEQFSQITKPPYNECGPFIITYIGQFTAWKNVELLFQAMTHLDKRFILRIAGGKNDQKSTAQIQTWTYKYHLQDQVDFKGFVAPKNLPKQVLEGSSALLLPLGDNIESRYFTSPMKLFEYMATSIPIVAVNYPSVNRITGEESVFLSENTPQAFAKKIEEAIACQDEVRMKKTNQLAQKYSYKTRAGHMHEFLQYRL
ncbi:MAG: glycosyltransferase family 4 protein [Chlamydiales bacterium]|nr:glycosyltransferase family 4 protein [Chlamydiales bacterium]